MYIVNIWIYTWKLTYRLSLDLEITTSSFVLKLKLSGYVKFGFRFLACVVFRVLRMPMARFHLQHWVWIFRVRLVLTKAVSSKIYVYTLVCLFCYCLQFFLRNIIHFVIKTYGLAQFKISKSDHMEPQHFRKDIYHVKRIMPLNVITNFISLDIIKNCISIKEIHGSWLWNFKINK